MIKSRPYLGFTCGSFDLLHAGHILMLKEAAKKCQFLMVGLQSDPTLDRSDTKNVPIQTVEERKIQLESLRMVSQVVVYDTEVDLLNLLKNYMPDVRIIGEDWKDRRFTGDTIEGIIVYYNSRSHNFSTSELRKRILEAGK